MPLTPLIIRTRHYNKKCIKKKITEAEQAEIEEQLQKTPKLARKYLVPAVCGRCGWVLVGGASAAEHG